jgi:hypothetical protein
MNDERDALTPAEQRVAALLALLRSDLVRTRPGLVAVIMRRVRWQQLVREFVSSLGNFASSVADGLTVFLGRSGGHKR